MAEPVPITVLAHRENVGGGQLRAVAIYEPHSGMVRADCWTRGTTVELKLQFEATVGGELVEAADWAWDRWDEFRHRYTQRELARSIANLHDQGGSDG